MAPIDILITGFGPFPGVPENRSLAVANQAAAHLSHDAPASDVHAEPLDRAGGAAQHAARHPIATHVCALPTLWGNGAGTLLNA
ncbi:MAG: hypothetical protein AAGF32_06295, partial [Pseudomonadota bacterium]